MHVGYERAGGRGLVVGGTAFILPAAAITLALAWAYERYGTTPTGANLLYGVEPVVIAVVAQAVWGLGRTAIRGIWTALLGVAVAALYLAGGNELVLLFGSGLVALMGRQLRARAGGPGGAALGLLPVGVSPALLVTVTADAVVSYSGTRLFLTFLKIGSLLYGSGYVLLAFLRNDFVERYGWLTEGQMLDAVAVGQVTPGPVFTTATFVGYLVGGFPGAVLATVGIFLPAFVVVALANPLLPRMRAIPWVGAALDGINVAAIGLMAAVGWELGWAAVVDLPTGLLAAASAALLVRYRVNSAWLVVFGATFGLASALWR